MTNEQELTKDSEFLKDQRERLGHALMSSLLTFADSFFFFFFTCNMTFRDQKSSK